MATFLGLVSVWIAGLALLEARQARRLAERRLRSERSLTLVYRIQSEKAASEAPKITPKPKRKLALPDFIEHKHMGEFPNVN